MPFANVILCRLLEYECLMTSDISQLAECLDPPILSNIIDYVALFMSYITFSGICISQQSNGTSQKRNDGERMSLLMELLEEEVLLHSGSDDEIMKYIQATFVGEMKIEPLQ